MIRNFEHFLTAVIFVFIGGFFGMYGLLHYETGTLQDMGPGWFPYVTSVALIILGGIEFIRSILAKEIVCVNFKLKMPLYITALIIAVAYAWPCIGAVPAIGLLMMSSGFINEDYKARWFFLSWAFIVILLLVFKYVLGMSIVLWNT
jgi:hypothetical protein